MVIKEVPKSRFKIINRARGKKIDETRYSTSYMSTINNPEGKRLIKAKKGVKLVYS